MITFGKIDIATVSPTRRGALVNWLVIAARVPVMAWTRDDEIESLWRQLHREPDHECIEVCITHQVQQ